MVRKISLLPILFSFIEICAVRQLVWAFMWKQSSRALFQKVCYVLVFKILGKYPWESSDVVKVQAYNSTKEKF